VRLLNKIPLLGEVMFKFVFICVSCLFALPNTCFADDNSPDIAPFIHIDVAPNVLVLDGDIDLRTALAFKRAIQKYPQTQIIALSSPGGSVQAALLIAEDIYEKRLTTYIPAPAICASACVYLFFSGATQLAEGKLGVHQISGTANVADAQLNISDILEALNKYGVSQEVITRMFRTPAQDIYFFTPAEVQSLGITRSSVANVPRLAGDVAKQTPEDDEATKARALSFVITLVNAGSEPKDKVLALSASAYTDVVSFFGQDRPKSDVLEEKSRYIERWPIRQSAIDTQTLSTTCVAKLCTVTGIYDWQVANPETGKRLVGTAEFEYRLNMSSDPKVLSEGGKVLSRKKLTSR
jgi:hypothetical protein